MEKEKEQTKEALREFLLTECFNKYSDYHKYLKRSPGFVYDRIVEIFEDFDLSPLSYDYFDFIRKCLLKDARVDEEIAINGACEKMLSSRPSPKNYRSPPKGTKRVRDPIYKEGYKFIVDMLYNSGHKYFLSGTDRYLIAKQMFLRAMGVNDDCRYICQTYGITSERFNEPAHKEYVQTTHRHITSCIEWLDFFLKQHIKDLIREYPESAKWLNDLFGPTLARYAPHVMQESGNIYKNKVSKESYKKYLKTFIKFVNGTSPLKLGYTKATYHNFTTHRIKAVIYILHSIHWLLYGLHEIHEEKERRVEVLVTKLKNNINLVLSSEPEADIQRTAMRQIMQSFGDLSSDISLKEALEKLYFKKK